MDNNKKDVLQDIAQLRYKIWQGKGIDMSNSLQEQAWLEDIDNHAYLWEIYREKELVASARLTYHDNFQLLPDYSSYENYQDHFPAPIASFNRLVVLHSYRNMKLSTYLNQMRIQQAVRLNAKSIILVCPESRIQSLLKQGFKQLSLSTSNHRYTSLQCVVMSKILPH